MEIEVSQQVVGEVEAYHQEPITVTRRCGWARLHLGMKISVLTLLPSDSE